MFHPSSMGASSSFSWRLPGENPNHQQEEPHLLFHFPSQFYDVVNNSDNDVSMNHHQIQVQNPVISGNLLDHTDRNPKNFGVLDGTKVDAQGGSNSSGVRRRSLGVIPRRKAGKKDRHSKICTAQGIRDRRMRLSLQVARKFFDLQDMLGYDKASKTIEWLFAKSMKAIKELTINNSNNNEQSLNVSSGDTKSDSFVSDCEVISEIEESSNKDAVKLEPTGDLKESNEKKRRTKDKKMIKDTSPTELGFSSFEQDPIFPNHVRNLPYGEDYTSLEQHPADCGTIEKLLGIPSSSFSAGSYMDPNVSFMGLLGWDIFTAHERGGSTSSNQVSPPGNSTPIYPSNH